MLCAVWSPVGGSGTTTTVALLARAVATRTGASIIDLAGDIPATVGMPGDPDVGVGHWLASGPDVPAESLRAIACDFAGVTLYPYGTAPIRVPSEQPLPDLRSALGGSGAVGIVDAGRAEGKIQHGVRSRCDLSIAVIPTHYLALRRATRDEHVRSADAVVIVDDQRGTISSRTVEQVVGASNSVVIPKHRAIANAVDAGMVMQANLDLALRPLGPFVDWIIALESAPRRVAS